ncbi:DUF4411 family protein [uncultured Slackia sp.]|uniref:DUF4411 family protein n=1 Tax=uncultured Slackia sp. TaxID=665903 RepID=UPI0025DE53AE|nr:DUF4411 family protein [uncultured Slackia sp.]
MKYLLDTNALIQSQNSFYAMDFCPGFWDFLERQFELGTSGSIQKVYDEIMAGKDALSQWTKDSIGKKTFIDQSANPAYQTKYLEIANYVQGSSQFRDSAKREFLKVEEADPWLAAVAAVDGCTVVTQEVLEPNAQRRVPLPNVLEEFGVPYADIFSFLRNQEACFVLESKMNCA